MSEVYIDQMQDEIADLKDELAMLRLENKRAADRIATLKETLELVRDSAQAEHERLRQERDELDADLNKRLEQAEQKLEMKEREINLQDQDAQTQASRERAIVAALNAAKERISVLEASLVGVRLIVEGVSHAQKATPGA